MNPSKSNPDDMVLYTLHLFAGGGGGIFADLLLGHQTIGAVEIEAYPRRMLLERQLAGMLPPFPIWDDIRTFRSDNPATRPFIEYCQSIRERLIIAGGFPCADVSVANPNAKGLEGQKSGLWFEMHRVVGEIRPRYVFIENSAALVSRGLGRILDGLAGLGYDISWGVISALDAIFLHHVAGTGQQMAQGRNDPATGLVGTGGHENDQRPVACHERKRLWIVATDSRLADADGNRREEPPQPFANATSFARSFGVVALSDESRVGDVVHGLAD